MMDNILFWVALWAVIAFALFVAFTRDETRRNFREHGTTHVAMDGFTGFMCAIWPFLLLGAIVITPIYGVIKLVERMCLPAEVRKARRKKNA